MQKVTVTEEMGDSTMTGQRLAVYLDIENLFHPFRQAQLWDQGLALIGGLLADVRANGTLVEAVGVCDRDAWQHVAFPLSEMGVRVFTHRGGINAADAALVDHIRTGLSPSVGTVMIASGDHYFAHVATELRHSGRRVIVAALGQSLSHHLYRAADTARLFPIPAACAA